jgi:DNA-directed RNA polymerase specialized sigma subunit
MLVNKVEICGVNTSKLPVLTSSQMQVLFEAMQKGDASARTQLVNGNLRLVLSIIQRFTNRGEYVDDLFQVGCIGLMKAIDNFFPGDNNFLFPAKKPKEFAATTVSRQNKSRNSSLIHVDFDILNHTKPSSVHYVNYFPQAQVRNLHHS